MDAWVQLCVFSVIFISEVILSVTELVESWPKLKIPLKCGEVQA